MALSGWNPSNKLKLTIDGTKVEDDLNNFPVCITLISGTGINSFDATVVFDELTTITGTKKIAITDEDDNQLYTEIESWDWSNEEAVLWVKVPTISSGTDTNLYLYYDATVSGNTTYIGDTGDSAAQNVWDDNFVAVYHMAQDPSVGGACVLDSTSNTKHGTPGGSMTSGDLVDGQIGKGLDFDGGDDYINLPTSLCDTGSLSDEMTVELCFNQRSYPGANSYSGLISKGDAWLTNRTFIYDLNKDGSTNTLRFSIGTGAGNAGASASYDVPILYSTNYYTAGKYDGSDVYLYLNDSEIDTSTHVGGDVYESSVTPVIGGLYTGDNGWSEFDGIIDELRISKVSRSEAWIKATYYSNWNDLITYSSIGPSYYTYYYSGYITEQSSPVARTVRLYYRDTGELVNSTTSSGINGYYYLTTTISGEHFIVAFDDDVGETYNALILDRLLPLGAEEE